VLAQGDVWHHDGRDIRQLRIPLQPLKDTANSAMAANNMSFLIVSLPCQSSARWKDFHQKFEQLYIAFDDVQTQHTFFSGNVKLAKRTG
jgi:hypothetical protein